MSILQIDKTQSLEFAKDEFIVFAGLVGKGLILGVENHLSALEEADFETLEAETIRLLEKRGYLVVEEDDSIKLDQTVSEFFRILFNASTMWVITDKDEEEPVNIYFYEDYRIALLQKEEVFLLTIISDETSLIDSLLKELTDKPFEEAFIYISIPEDKFEYVSAFYERGMEDDGYAMIGDSTLSKKEAVEFFNDWHSSPNLIKIVKYHFERTEGQFFQNEYTFLEGKDKYYWINTEEYDPDTARLLNVRPVSLSTIKENLQRLLSDS